MNNGHNGSDSDIATTKLDTQVGSGSNVQSQNPTQNPKSDDIAYVKLDVIKNHATIDLTTIDIKDAGNKFNAMLNSKQTIVNRWIDEDTAHFE